MDRARELFEKLEAGGLAALERLLAEEEPDSLFLDYKRAVTAAGDPGPQRSDRENLSKALSGFATLGTRDSAPERFYIGVNDATMADLPERLRASRLNTDAIWETDAPAAYPDTFST